MSMVTNVVAWALLGQPGACPEIAYDTEPSRVVALLVGYPAAPTGAKLPDLLATDDDVLRMRELFEILGAEQQYVHLAPSPGNQARTGSVELRPPTLRGLGASVADIVASTAVDPAAPIDVYVYIASHGLREWKNEIEYSKVFLAPDPETGHDGVVTSEALFESVLAPLDRLARVHLIADACQSGALIESRGVTVTKRTRQTYPPRSRDMIDVFVARYAHTGAVLATSAGSSTFERPDVGGIFSYAVRSAALGLGDLDGDGVVRYGELRSTIHQIMAGQGGSEAPVVLGQENADEAPFLELRGRGLARICIPAEGRARLELFDRQFRDFAILREPTDGELAVYLPHGSRWRVRSGRSSEDAGDWFQLEVSGGPLAEQRRWPLDERARGGALYEGLLLPHAVDRALRLAPPERGALHDEGRWTVGASGAALLSPSGGGFELPWAMGVDLHARYFGGGPHQLLVEAAWIHGRGAVGRYSNQPGHPLDFDGAAARVGYAWRTWDGRGEAALEGLLGLDLVGLRLDAADTVWAVGGTVGAGLRWVLPLPAESPFAATLRARALSRLLCRPECEVDLLAGVSAGMEWELER